MGSDQGKFLLLIIHLQGDPVPLPQLVVLEQEDKVLVGHELLAPHLQVLEDPVVPEPNLEALDLEEGHKALLMQYV